MIINTFPLNQTNLINPTNNKKLLLADYILEYFTPLFDEEINRQSKQLENINKDYSTIVKKVNDSADGLKKVKHGIMFENLKKIIFEKIYVLKKRDMLYGPYKDEAFKFMTNCENLNIDQLNEKLKYFETVLTKHLKGKKQ